MTTENKASVEGYMAGYAYGLQLAKQANQDQAILEDLTPEMEMNPAMNRDEADAIKAQNDSWNKAQATKQGGGIREKALALLQSAKNHKAEIGAGLGGAGLGFGGAKMMGMKTPGAVGVGLGTGAAAAGLANILKRYADRPALDAADKSLLPRG